MRWQAHLSRAYAYDCPDVQIQLSQALLPSSLVERDYKGGPTARPQGRGRDDIDLLLGSLRRRRSSLGSPASKPDGRARFPLRRHSVSSPAGGQAAISIQRRRGPAGRQKKQSPIGHAPCVYSAPDKEGMARPDPSASASPLTKRLVWPRIVGTKEKMARRNSLPGLRATALEARPSSGYPANHLSVVSQSSHA